MTVDESKVLNLKASSDAKDYGSVSPGSPKPHQMDAMPTACIFILAVELCERLAFYTFTGTQEFFLEKTGYSLAQANALTTAMNTLCMAFAVFAGWVADVQLGRFMTIIIFGVTYSIGGLLATTAAAPSFMNSGLYLFALLVLVPMGTAGIKSNISNFGADQYDVSDPEQVAAQEQFFQWFYMAINVGSAFAYAFLTALGTNGGMGIPKEYGYFAAYFIASMCMLFAVVCLFCVRGRYRTSPLQRTSAMADVCKRISQEIQQGNRWAQLAALGAALAGSAIACSVASALLQNELSHGHVLIFSMVAFALASVGALMIIISCECPDWVSDIDLPGVSLSAADTRGFLKLLPVIITAQMAFGAIYNCMQYSFQQQACQMDVRIPGSGESQFAGSFFMIGDCLGITIATPIAVGWFNPLLESRLGNYFSHEGKFLFCMMVGGLSVVLAAYLELLRRSMPVMDRISNCAPDGVHMSELSAVWMFLPFLLCGIGEIYTNPVIMHLAYSSSSAATRTLAVVATLLVQALGTAIFGVQITALSQFMPNDLNDGHIEYGYYMSLGIGLFFYVAFVRSMRIFRP